MLIGTLLIGAFVGAEEALGLKEGVADGHDEGRDVGLVVGGFVGS